jgi:broad specificity phosphatase PhoE
MSRLRRLVMIRHGETVGNSSVRFHGSGDVALSDEGRRQMRAVSRQLLHEAFDLVVASPLRRSWEGAWIVSGGPVRLEADFREIDFGRWEGLTAEEIEASDPVLFKDWQERRLDFSFPGGEQRGAFRERVLQGFRRLESSGASSALLVVHKGPIRTIAEELGAPTADGALELGGVVGFSRAADGSWFAGRRSSNPDSLKIAAS